MGILISVHMVSSAGSSPQEVLHNNTPRQPKGLQRTQMSVLNLIVAVTLSQILDGFKRILSSVLLLRILSILPFSLYISLTSLPPLHMSYHLQIQPWERIGEGHDILRQTISFLKNEFIQAAALTNIILDPKLPAVQGITSAAPTTHPKELSTHRTQLTPTAYATVPQIPSKCKALSLSTQISSSDPSSC